MARLLVGKEGKGIKGCTSDDVSCWYSSPPVIRGTYLVRVWMSGRYL